MFGSAMHSFVPQLSEIEKKLMPVFSHSLSLDVLEKLVWCVVTETTSILLSITFHLFQDANELREKNVLLIMLYK